MVIIDDHPLVREGLQARFASEPDFETCGFAADVQEGLRLIETVRPDVAIVDLTLRSSDGLELIKRVRAKGSSPKILVVSAHDEIVFAERALRAGALGYVHKQEIQGNIIAALRAVCADQLYFSPSVAQHLAYLATTGPGVRRGVDALSNRELEIFQLIGQGYPTRSIAAWLHLSPHTIESHRERIRRKLNLANGSELVRHAVQWVLEKTH